MIATSAAASLGCGIAFPVLVTVATCPPSSKSWLKLRSEFRETARTVGRALDEILTSVKSDAAESSAGGGGPVESYSGRILVEDASGSRFYVHEYRGRGLLRPVR